MYRDKSERSSSSFGANQKASRRKVLKHTLIGGTVISASVLPDRWTKPLINTVVTPAHAQTSTTVVLGGQLSSTVPKQAASSTDTLNIFLNSANATNPFAPLNGGCLTLDINGSDASAEVVLNNGVSDSRSGTVDGTLVTISSLHGGYTLSGTLDSATSPTSCSGSITGFGETGSFTVSEGSGTCTPIPE